MSYAEPFSRIAENLRRDIEEAVSSLGILCRIFGRGKSTTSLQKKFSDNPDKYFVGGKLVQDCIGVRVVIYFPEDIRTIQNLLCRKYQYDERSSTIDLPSASDFSVSRHNLIFKVPDHLAHEMVRAIGILAIDTVFEVQIRTILSEGWHEVEHDLRYKCPTHWKDEDELNRALNGIVATLETAEWSMRKMFDELSYKHYKKRNWAAMLHTSLRMRLAPIVSEQICDVFNSNNDTAKAFSRINKAQIIDCLSKLEPLIPINIDNLVYLWNYVHVDNEQLHALTPEVLRECFERSLTDAEG